LTKLLEHKHLIIRAEVQEPPKNVDEVNVWVKNLVSEIDMEIMMGPYSAYSTMVGNRGLTTATVISTSHIVLHSWDEVDPGLVMLDVYTCSHLDLDVVFKAMEVFKPTKIEYKFLDREHGLTLI